jgi:hypothetical protein
MGSDNIKMRFVLTWDPTPAWPNPGSPSESTPNDLDAHLWLSALIPAHVSSQNQGDCTNYPNACLEVDYQLGFGPETVAIRELEVAKYFYGVLNYYQDYPGVPPITKSAAKVQIYDENGLVQAFQAPTSGQGDFWYVFSMDQSGSITPQNCILYYSGGVPKCP